MYLLVKTLSLALRALPRGLLDALGALAGLAWYWLVPIRRRVAIDNVSAALTGGDRAAAAVIVRHSFVNLCKFTLAFAARCPGDTAGVTVEGDGPLKAAVAAGKGAIVATAHTGDWDLNEMTGPAIGVHLHVLTRKVHMRGIQRFWEESRTARRNVYLPHNTAVTEMLGVLRAGGCLALVYDQNMPPKRGVRVPFFGRDASTSFAPAVLHFRTGAPIFPTFGARMPDGRYVIRIHPPLDAMARTGDLRADSAAMMTALNRLLEDWIRQYPDQWLWVHRRWK